MSYDSVILGDSPVLYITSTLTDQGSGSHTITTVGSPSASASLPNGDPGWTFNGSTDYLEVASQSDLSVATTGSLTVEGWINSANATMPGFVNNDQINFISKASNWPASGGTNQYEWEIRYYNLGAIDTGNASEAIVGYGYTSLAGGTGFGNNDTNGVPVGQWIYVAVVYTSTAVTLYRNGIQVATATIANAPLAGIAPLTIGAGQPGGTTCFFDGSIGKIAVYSSALTQTQLSNHYAAMGVVTPALPPPPPPGVLPVTLIGSPGSTGVVTTGTQGSNLTGVYGQTPTAGHLLVAAYAWSYSSTTGTQYPAVPTGWTLFSPPTWLVDESMTSGIIAGPFRCEVAFYWKRAAGGDAAPTFIEAAKTVAMGAVIFELANASELFGGVNNNGTYNTNNGTAVVYNTSAPGTVTTPGSFVVFASTTSRSSTGTGTYTPSAGFINVLTNASTSSDSHVFIDYSPNTAAGSLTVAPSFTLASAVLQAAAWVAIPPQFQPPRLNAQNPPTANIKQRGNQRKQKPPRQAAYNPAPKASSNQYFETLSAVLTALTGIQRQVSQNDVTTVNVTASTTNFITRGLVALTAVTGNTTRSITRTIAAAIAVIASTVRNLGKRLLGTVAATNAVTAGRVRLATLIASVAATASTQRMIGRILAAVIAVTGATGRSIARAITAVTVIDAAVTRKISRTFSGPVATVASAAIQRLKVLTLSAPAAVTVAITRKVQPNIKASLIIVSGTTRSIGRAIQGNLISAGQTLRSVDRVITTVVTANPAVQRALSRVLGAVIATTVSAVESAVTSILGAFHIIIPGSCAKIEKGVFAVTLPVLKVKLAGTVGTFSVFGIIIPVLKVSLTGTVNLLAVKIPVPVVTITGKVLHQPLNVKLPAPGLFTEENVFPAIPGDSIPGAVSPGMPLGFTLTGLRGIVGHAGSFGIDFGNCAQLMNYLMSPVTLPAPEQANIEWVAGGAKSNWQAGVPWTRWSLSYFAGLNISYLDTQYIRIGVSALINGMKYNPTGDTVQFAFMPNSVQVPQISDWVTGSWETTGSPIYPYRARCLIGPNGAVNLTPGSYIVYVKIIDNPEVPVLVSGVVTVF